MRPLCTVSGPVQLPAGASAGSSGTSAGCALPPTARFLALRVPGATCPPHHFLVESKTRVRELRERAHTHLHQQGVDDVHLFGLAVLFGNDHLFADLDSKLSKYAPKNWRSSHTHGLDANGKPLLELCLAVQFYVDSPLLLHDDVSRQYYYQQLRTNLATREHISLETALTLSGLILQAEKGDSQSLSGREQNLDNIENADDNEINTVKLAAAFKGMQVSHELCASHLQRRGLESSEAKNLFLKEACASPDPINAHCFRLRSSKTEGEPGSVWLTLRARGVEVAPDGGAVSFFVWSSITKLSFDRKKFEIRSGDAKITLYSSTDEKSKMLLTLCRETHQFSMKIAPELSEVLKQEEEERHCHFRSLNLPYCKLKSDQRISVISTTSSNTTSGIVSDRVHSEDELEIMIDTPPAPSTESLAFAHLLDNTRSYNMKQFNRDELVRRSSLAIMTQSSLSKHISDIPTEQRLGIPHVDCSNNLTKGTCNSATELMPNLHEYTKVINDSPLMTKLKCTSSQCSSSCSTVVVSSANRRIRPRRTSTASSLELGYSHTAQNSVISDSFATYIESDCSILRRETEETHMELYDGIGQPATVAASSETSGVYTMGSSELTGESSEIAEIELTCSSRQHNMGYDNIPMLNNDSLKFETLSDLNYDQVSDQCSSRSPLKFNGKSDNFTDLDCVDGLDAYESEDDEKDSMEFRFRTNSNLSASESFHGDGSDPTDNKYNLLSAQELSELIVGRGTYPKLKTVSDTLDSDCDYVTLPLPMEGDSYIQGHEDTAPSDENYPELDIFLQDPPKIPQRIDSWQNGDSLDVLKPPPPYTFNTKSSNISNLKFIDTVNIDSHSVGIPKRDPPPYPDTPIKVRTSREEVPARFVTSKPQINVLTAEASTIVAQSEPSFSTPAIQSHSTPFINDLRSFSLSAKNSPMDKKDTRYHRNASINKYDTDQNNRMLVPMMKPMRLLPPPPTLSRQPPPPPPALPNQGLSIFTSKLAQSQMEQYQQQLCSDVDYVIYPLQDPAISQQNYLDSKLVALARTSYHSNCNKNSLMYRSTPYLALSYSSDSHYSSNQNLSDTYIQLPSAYSPVYNPSSHASSTSRHSIRSDPPPLPQRPRLPLPLPRTKSDDNILSSVDSSKATFRRLPPPPPPPLPPYKYKKKMTSLRQFDRASKALPPEPCEKPKTDSSGPIDIKTLREKSKNLDLPLISALCNDRSLLKQTKAFVMPKHPTQTVNNDLSQNLVKPKQSNINLQDDIDLKLKYPVSGISAVQLNMFPSHKTHSNHRHPNDKLPEIPGVETCIPRAPSNTYVPHPSKHKKTQ